MPSGRRSLHNLAFGSLALSLCFASTSFAQETQREQPQPPKIVRKSGGVLQGSAVKLYLGIVYATAGNTESAMREYDFLKEKNPEMANQLMELMKKQR